IHMQVWSTEPGVQFYGGNFMQGKENGKGGKPLGYRTAFCLEPQHFPDSPNRPEYPTTVLMPGDTFRSVISYRFGR
ncbi:MAG: galactose-1-epimerase, partial [Bacteroidetes bacterium]